LRSVFMKIIKKNMGKYQSKRLNNPYYGSYPETNNASVYACHRLGTSAAGGLGIQNMNLSSNLHPPPVSFVSDFDIYSLNFYQQFQSASDCNQPHSISINKISSSSSHQAANVPLPQTQAALTKQGKPPTKMANTNESLSPWMSTSSSSSSNSSSSSSSGSGGSQLKKQTNITKSKLLQELLECPICMNLFEIPTCLPCQHTFCKKCIVSLQCAGHEETATATTAAATVLGQNATISCPICR
jgi:hypothetical protein